MSLDLETVPETAVQGDLLEAAASPLTLSLQDFVSEFGDELLDSLNRANPPVYTGQVRVHRQLILAALKRKLFTAQADVVHAVTELLVDRGERAAIVNGEMGCGKTTVGIATAAVLNRELGEIDMLESRRRWPVPRSGCSMARTRWSSC